MKPASSYHFGDFEVQVALQRIVRNGQSIHLRAKTFQVLLHLLEHRDRLVTKQEILDSLWADVTASDASLVQCIIDLRKALCDDARNPRFIRTVSKVGYQFIGALDERSGTAAEANGTGTPKVAKWSVPRLTAAAAAVLAACLALGWVVARPKAAGPSLVLRGAGKVPVAVMFFENQSGGRDIDWLREGLAEMLITNLSGSSRLAVLSRSELQSLMQRTGKAPGAPRRLEDALVLAEKSHAEMLVLGEFAQLGDKIRINVHLHDAHTGRLLASESATAETPGQIIPEMDLLSLKLGGHLGAARNESERRAVSSTSMTGNLEAYRAYSLAVEKAKAYHSDEAIALFEKAIALDPRFAMAYARIGYIYAVTWGQMPDKGKTYLEKAFQLSDRLTERDRLYISAWYAIANYDYPAAIDTMRRLVAEYPGEIEAYAHLGKLLRGEERFDEAIIALKQGLPMDHEAGHLYNALGGIYSQQGRHAEAIAAERQQATLSPNESNAMDSLALAYLSAGHFAEAEQAFQQALRLKPGFDVPAKHLAVLYYRLGRYNDAIQALENYLRASPSQAQGGEAYLYLAWCWKRKGNLGKAIDALTRAVADYPDKAATSMMLELWRGDEAAAEKLMPQLRVEWICPNREARAPTRRHRSYVLGRFFLSKGQTNQALSQFHDALQHWGWWADANTYEDCLGDALRELGRLDQAIAEYERVLRTYPATPLTRFNLALAYRSKGDGDRAAAEFRQFLELWKNADPGLEEVRAAKEYLAKSKGR